MLHKKVILSAFIIRSYNRNFAIIFIHFSEKCILVIHFMCHFWNKKEDTSNSSNKVYYYNYLKPKYEENIRIFIVFLKPHFTQLINLFV